MELTTITSRTFNQDASGAKRAAQNGPVFITDRGKPAHVLLSIEAYRRLTGQRDTIEDLRKRLDRAEDRILALSAPAAEPMRQGRTGSDGARPSTLAAAEAERDRLQGVVQSLSAPQARPRRWWPF